jgi:hypothetical protein
MLLNTHNTKNMTVTIIPKFTAKFSFFSFVRKFITEICLLMNHKDKINFIKNKFFILKNTPIFVS